MASVSSFNDSLWRASISDRPRHKSPKQIYYPKQHFSKRQAKQSASNLEYRHKDGNDDFDLWKADITISGDKVLLRQLEGEKTIRFSRVFSGYFEYKARQVSRGTRDWYKMMKRTVIKQVGDFYFDTISEQRLNGFINSGKYRYRQAKYSFLKGLFEYTKKKYGTDIPDLEVLSTRTERKEVENKVFKTFIVEGELYELLDSLMTDKRQGIQLPREKLCYFFLLSFYLPRRLDDYLHLSPEWIGEQIVTIGDDTYKPKSGMIEKIIQPEEVRELLSTVLRKYGDSSPIFDYNYNAPSDVFKREIQKLWPEKSKKLSLHKLRDSGILYLLYEKDWNEKNVMAITGHSSFSSFEKYIHKNAKAIIQEKKSEYPVKSWLQKKNKWFDGTINY